MAENRKYFNFFRGVVKDNRDTTGMGRIRAFIPALGGNPDDESAWYTLSYVSKYGGSTGLHHASRDGEDPDTSQHSYGQWAAGQQIGAQIIVAFLDGDPSKGVFLGNLLPEGLGNSLADTPSMESPQGKVGGKYNPPTLERNITDDSQKPDSFKAAVADTLSRSLWTAGLISDFLRGPSDVSMFRDLSSQFTSMKSMIGNTFYIDDGKQDKNSGARPDLAGTHERKFKREKKGSGTLRVRSRSGAQFMLNSRCGFIYQNSKDGTSWQNISNAGISGYSARDINYRAVGGHGTRSDGTYMFEADGNVNIKVLGTTVLDAPNGLSITSGGTMSFEAGSDIDLFSNSTTHFDGASGISSKAGGDHIDFAGGTLFNNSAGESASDATPIQTGEVVGKKHTMTYNEAHNTSSESIDGSYPKGSESSSYYGEGHDSLKSDLGPNAEGSYSDSQEQSAIPAGDLPTHEGDPGQHAKDCKEEDPEPKASESDNKREQGNSDGSINEVDAPDANSGLHTPGEFKPGELAYPVDINADDQVVTSSYGPRNVPGGSKYHKGIDLRGRNGENAIAVADGKVTRVGTGQGFGRVVEVTHSDGHVSRYAHLGSYGNVKVGDTITRGTPVGTVGGSWASKRGGTPVDGRYSPHLHFEIINPQGKRVNPLPYFNRNQYRFK